MLKQTSTNPVDPKAFLKNLLFTDGVIALSKTSSGLDQRFVTAHEEVKGVPLFERNNSFVSAIYSNGSESVISEVVEKIATAAHITVCQSADKVCSNDLLFITIDCAKKTSTETLNDSIECSKDVPVIIELINTDKITEQAYNTLSNAIKNQQIDGRTIERLFITHSICEKDFTSITSNGLQSKLLTLGVSFNTQMELTH
ncbi:MAG: hypothetical protein HAW67_06940 [Endozoicomonadaceae bacterium]|nr:hypothetical protein [Endozoicomonadaceae bacterium]